MLKKLSLSLIIALLFLLNTSFVFARLDENPPSGDYNWSSATQIESRNFGTNFNITVQAPEAVADFAARYSSLSYYLFVSEKSFKVDTRGGTVELPYTLVVSKEDTSSGTLLKPTGADIAASSIRVYNPNGAAPAPLKVINKGAIWGKVFPEGDWEGTSFEEKIVKANASIKLINDNGAEVRFKTHGGNGSQIDADNNFSKFSFSDLEDGGLYEGRYRLTFYNKDSGSCETGSTEGVGLCSIELRGILNFDLQAVGGGVGKVVLIDNDKEEQAAAPNGIKTTELESNPALRMNITYTKTSPFDAAIEAMMDKMINSLKWAIEKLSGWVKIILDSGNFINDVGIIEAWTKVRNLGLSLLTLGLLIIAFANILSIDIERYGLNRMIPKLVIAIVMTYFSFLIATFLMELASAFQEKLIGSEAVNFANTVNTSTKDAAEAMATGGELVLNSILGIILFVIIVVALLYLCLVLIVRIAVLWFLVAVAPLAFLMQVMPFTESLYKQWWDKFFKWLFMGPAIAFMIWLSTIMLESFGTQFGKNGDAWLTLLLAAACIFMAAAIPMQMGGDVLKAIQSAGKKYGAKVPGVGTLSRRAKAFSSERQKAQSERASLWANKWRTKAATRGGWAGRQVAGVNKAQRDTMIKGLVLERTKKIEETGMDSQEAQKKFLSLKDATSQNDIVERGALARYLGNIGLHKDDDAATIDTLADLIKTDPVLKTALIKNQPSALAAMELRGHDIGKLGSLFASKADVKDLKARQIELMAKTNTAMLMRLLKNVDKMKRANTFGDETLHAAIGEAIHSLSPEQRAQIKVSPEQVALLAKFVGCHNEKYAREGKKQFTDWSESKTEQPT